MILGNGNYICGLEKVEIDPKRCFLERLCAKHLNIGNGRIVRVRFVLENCFDKDVSLREIGRDGFVWKVRVVARLASPVMIAP